MAVENLKVQLEFRMGEANWSEIYYRSGSDPKGGRDPAIAMARERLKLCVPVAAIHHIRISAAQPGGRSYRFPLVAGSGTVSGPDRRDVGPVTNTVGVYSASGVFRKLKFHGYPDNAITFDPAGVPDTALGGATANFLGFLKANGWQIRHIATPAREATKKIWTIAVAANGTVTFGCDTTGLALGQKVRVSSCQGYHAGQFNGVWTVSGPNPLSPVSFTASSKRYIDPNFFYVGSSGSIRDGSPAGYIYLPIDDWDLYQSPGTRKVGRPTDSPRGRQSSRR